jgi:hypothetical protein
VKRNGHDRPDHRDQNHHQLVADGVIFAATLAPNLRGAQPGVVVVGPAIVGAFDVIEHRSDAWSLELDSERTVALYATFSEINAHPDRLRLLTVLGRIAHDEFEGRVTRNMTTSLDIARHAK